TFHGHVFHGYFNKAVTSIFKIIERYLAKKSDAIVAISSLQKDELCFKYSICTPEKTHIIPLGFDLDRFTQKQDEKRDIFRRKYFLKEDEIAIGIIGRLAPIKNHSLFINSINHLKNSTKKRIKAFIIGDGDTKTSLENYCTQLNLMWNASGDNNPDIVFTSWIKEVDVALAGLDMVCLTSLNEGTPVSLIEAQAASRYIVSTNVGGIKDILNPECGLLSEPDDPEAFNKNLLYAVENFDSVKQKASLAKEEVIQKFGYQRLCDDMEKLYGALLAKKKGKLL
ncbi:MAG: glycosyltransferase family 4 protein, partial [Bacteroidia bacterium]|nr:glycosyltransferase family 4 protein [Bacteroidia bacterium]